MEITKEITKGLLTIYVKLYLAVRIVFLICDCISNNFTKTTSIDVNYSFKEKINSMR